MTSTLEVASPQLPSRKEIEGYDGKRLMGWLLQAAPPLAAAENWTTEARLAVGLALWRLRDEVTESEYTVITREIATEAKVSRSTLWRWRSAAQDEYGLEQPAGALPRSDAQQPRPRPDAIDADAEEIPAPALDIEVPAAEPPAAAPPRPAAPAARPEPQSRQEPLVDPPAQPFGPASTAARRVVEAVVTFSVDELAASCSLPALRDARARLERAERLRAEQAAPQSTATKAKAAAKRTPAADPSASCAEGKHPKDREQKLPYGTFCGDCRARIR